MAGACRTLLLLLAAALAAACVDLSALKEAKQQYSNSWQAWVDAVDAVGEAEIPADLLPDAAPPDAPAPDAVEPLTLLAVEPAAGPISGNTQVLLTGTGFAEPMQVFFGPQAASELFVVDSGFATVVTPANPPGLVDVRVAAPDGREALLPSGFLYEAALSLSAIDPAQGSALGGTPVLVSGAGFAPDCQLFLGTRMATYLTVLDSFTLEAVTPPGDCGPEDLRIICGPANALLKNAFYYDGIPRLDSVIPAAGPTAGGTPLALSGDNFTPDMTVHFNGDPAAGFTFLSPQSALLHSPPASKGAAAVTLVTPCGQHTKPSAFIYLDPDAADSPPQIIGVVPDHLPACAGGYATIGLEGLGDPDQLAAMLGTTPCELVAIDEDLGSIDILIAPMSPAAYDLTVTTSAGPALLPQAITLTPAMAVTGVSPPSGPPQGGTPVSVTGCGFGSSAEVAWAMTPGTATKALSQSQIQSVSPAGPPGPVDVTVASGSKVATLYNGFTYAAPQPTLYFLAPAYGAIAGGTYLRFVGTGLLPNAQYLLGDTPCLDVHWVSSALVTARAPAHKPGTVAATVLWDGGSLTLPDAYTYFDPLTKKGGTWGDPIDEALNVTVLDSSTGKGLPAALVCLGPTCDDSHSGFTDENGQLTFSAPGLEGKQSITAAKPGYTLYSVIHFDAQNVTIYLSPNLIGEYGDWNPTYAYVAGTVHGFEKYSVIPPGNCFAKDVSAPLCAPCMTDEQCLSEDGSLQAWCADIGDTGKYCVTPCDTSADCPDGFACASVALDKTGCIPRAGKRMVRCQSSKTSLFGYPPDPGPGGTANEHDIYFIPTNLGEIAIQCFGGYEDYDTKIFYPMVMGLRRHVYALKNQVLKDQDVTLDIPLTSSGKVALFDVPYYPDGLHQPYIISSIELGKDGYINLPREPQYVEQGMYFLIDPLPAQMTGTLEGATFSIYGSVQSNTMTSMPYAVRMVEDIPSLAGDGMVLAGKDPPLHLYPPLLGDIVGIRFNSLTDMTLATSEGELVHYDGVAWTPVGIADAKEGFTCMYLDAQGILWLGGKQGHVWYRDLAGAWTRIETGLYYPVRAIWASEAKAVVAYDWMLATVGPQGLEFSKPAPTGNKLRGVWGSDLDDLWVITDQHAVWTPTQTAWDVVAQYETYDLRAVSGTGPDDVWIVGSPGIVLHWNGNAIEEIHPADLRPLTAISTPQYDRVFVAGTDGLLLAWDGDAFLPLATDTIQDFLALAWSPTDDLVAAAGIQAYNLGPFAPFPHILSPADDSTFDWTAIAWTFWTPDATADYHYLLLSNQDGYPFWTLVVDGETTTIELPPVVKQLGANVFPDGEKRLNLTSSLFPEFEIDNFTFNDFSIYSKVSWSVDMTSFQ